MSTCAEISGKIDTLQSSIESFRTEFDKFQEDLAEVLTPVTDKIDEVIVNQQFIVNTIGELLKPMNEEQLLQSNGIKQLGKGLSNLYSCIEQNNKFINELSKQPIFNPKVITAISNTEAVSKALNIAYLGVNNGSS